MPQSTVDAMAQAWSWRLSEIITGVPRQRSCLANLDR
jgi:hypothetical protein